ncbi:MAG: hypothetical protein FWF80_04575 [Defluviitaleaceae bacterium]|nr:hypothetical protein [Defluviitaleaceae bacterium]
MEKSVFEGLKTRFKSANTDEKIRIYVESEELTQNQYKELLHLFPLSDLNKLEAALA